MNTYLKQAESALAHYTGEVAAHSVLQEQAAALSVLPEAIDAETYPLVVDGVAGMLEELVGQSAAVDFRQEALQGAAPVTHGYSPRRIGRRLLLLFGIVVVAMVAGPWSLPWFGTDLLQGLIRAAACVLLAQSALGSRTRDRSWLILSVGMAGDAAAFIYYWYLETITGQADPFPTMADLLWLVSAVLLVVGIIWALVRLRHYGLVRLKATRGMFVALLFTAVMAAEVLIFRIGSGDLGFLITLLYPILDLVVIAASLLVLQALRRLGRGRLAVPWRIIAVAMIPATASDLLYAMLRPLGLYQTGGLTDMGWLLQSLLIMWAALEMRHLHN